MTTENVTIALSREDAATLYELVVTEANLIERAEVSAECGLGSSRFRRPADAVGSALGLPPLHAR